MAVPTHVGAGPGHDEVQVLVLRLDGTTLPAFLGGLVSDEERARAAHLRRAECCQRYLASHALARSAVATSTGLDPAEVAFTRRCLRCGHPTHGRPRLASVPASGPLELSLARTAGLVAVAVGRAPVGIDVEATGAQLSGLRQVLSPAELAYLDRLGADDRIRAGYRAWVAKEAVGKVRGSGLIGVRELEVAPATATAWRTISDGADTWQVRLLDLGPAHAGAVAATLEPTSITLLDASEGG